MSAATGEAATVYQSEAQSPDYVHQLEGPWLTDGHIVVSDLSAQRVVCLEDADGWPEEWHLQLDGPVGLQMQSGCLVAIAREEVVSIDPQTGSVEWRQPLHGMSPTVVAGPEQLVYLLRRDTSADRPDVLIGLDPDDGSRSLQYSGLTVQRRAAAIDPRIYSGGDRIVVVQHAKRNGSAHSLVEIVTEDGRSERRWLLQTERLGRSQQVIAAHDEGFYVAAYNELLECGANEAVSRAWLEQPGTTE
jgi:hypothetical protein